MEGSATVSTIAGDARRAEFSLSRRELLLIFAFWTALAVLTAANQLLDPRGPGIRPTLPPSAPIALAFVESYLWALLTIPIFWMASRYSPERGNRVARVLLFIAVGVAAAVLVDATTNELRAQLFQFPLGPRRRGPPPGPFSGLRRLWFLNDLIMYFAILSAGIARDFFLRYRARQEEAVLLGAHAAQLQAQLAEARLAALSAQLNPHFLFNTLHAVSSLVERDPRGVRRMIARLSELLRATLEGTIEQEITLAKELDLLRRYLEIMEIRFQGRLVVDVRIDDGVLDALVPNLVLQPLVENAVMHGVSKVSGAGRIELHARRSGETLVLTVRDNGPGLGAGELDSEPGGVDGDATRDAPDGDGARSDRPSGGGVGLRNTRARLSELYGDDQQLVLRSAAGGGTVAEIRLPYHTRSDLQTEEIPAVLSTTA